MQLLQANTEIKVRIGPFVDKTDGVTPETGVTLGAADQAELLKNNGAATVDISGATWAAVTNCSGWYDLTLTTSHTDTEGLLTVVVQDADVCLPVFAHFMVAAQASFASLFTAKDTGYMDINVKAVSEDTTAADNLESACDNYSATRGLAGTALPAAAADAAGGLIISDAGGLDIDAMNANVSSILTDTGTDGVVLANDAITAAKFDETTAFPLVSADSGATAVARTGADGDTLETLSDQIDATATAAALATHDGKLDVVDGIVDSILDDTGTTLPAEHAALATSAALATAQADLDILTGADGVTLATLQANYAPAVAGDAMNLANDAITAAKYDETTAFPVASADSGATQIARTGADADTLETLSDQIDLQALASVCTESRLAELDAANLPADVGAILTDTGTTIPAQIAALNNLSAAQVNAECDTALTDIHLDHLFATAYDATSKPGAADALLNEMVEDDGGLTRYTANALEQAPGGGGGGDATAANQTTIINHLTDVKGTGFVKDTHSLPQCLTATAGNIQTACDAALVANHLDHLFKTAYDATSKPGAADALLNELMQDDAGVTQYTTNALENAPSGSSITDWTADERKQIREALGLTGVTASTSGSGIIDLLKKIAEADMKVITTDASQWVIVWYEKGTSTEIMRKNMKDLTGTAITASGTVVGQHVHTT